MKLAAVGLLLASVLFAESTLTHQAGITITANAWTDVGSLAGGVHPYPVHQIGFNSSAYVPILHAGCWWETYITESTENNDGLMCYSFRENRFWYQDITSNNHNENLPYGGHTFGVLAYAPSLNSWIDYHYGAGSSGPEQSPPSNWIYDFAGGVGKNWNTNSPSTGNPTPFESLVYAADRDIGVYLEYYNSAIFHWTPATNLYVKQTVTGAVQPLQSPGHVYNGIDGKIYFFGGQNGAGCSNVTYTYDPGSQTWATLSTMGGPPGARWSPGIAWDSKRNGILLIGSSNCNDSSGPFYGDTWYLDLTTSPATWTQLSPTSIYNFSNSVNLVFNSLVYDPDDDVFLLATGSTSAPHLYIYAMDSSSNVGALTGNHVYPNGSRNVSTGTPGSADSFAYGSSLSTDGTSLYEMHSESGSVTAAKTEHPAGRFWNSTSWSSGATVDSSSVNKSDFTTQAMFSGTPHVAFMRFDTSGGSGVPKIWTSSFSGGVWSTAASTITVNGSASGPIIGQLVNCGGTPVVAQIEQIHNGLAGGSMAAYEIHVVQFTGGVWSAVGGTTALNRNASSEVHLLSVACTSTSNIWVAWNEDVPTFASNAYTYDPQIYVSFWNGSTWAQRNGGGANGSLNVTGTDWASDPWITFLGTTPYVLWVERPVAGSSSGGSQALPPNLLYASSWNGSAWVAAGSQPINRNTNASTCYNLLQTPCSWVWHPACDTDGTNLFCSWVEQESPNAKPQVYASEWNGTTWAALGGSANASTQAGSPTHASLVYYSNLTNPVVSWTEQFPGLMRQSFVSAFNASAGTFQPLGLGCAISPTSLGPWTVGQVNPATLTESGCNASTFSLTSSWPTGLSGCSSGAGPSCNVTGTISANGTFSPTVSYDVASNLYTIVVNVAPSITTTCPLPNGRQNTLYNPPSGLQLADSGGTTPLSWSLSSGTLPSGLSLSGSGLITGTPTSSGTSSFTLQVTDSNNISATESCSLQVVPSVPPMSVFGGKFTLSGRGTR